MLSDKHTVLSCAATLILQPFLIENGYKKSELFINWYTKMAFIKNFSADL